MAETKNIYQAISEVMGKLGAIGKDKFNQTQKYKYRGVDDVMNALAPLLTEAGLFIVPEVLEQSREERLSNQNKNLIYSICKIRYTFYAKDGSHVEAVVIGEGMDSGDKASNKAMAVAFKYACFQVFCIPTEESKEPTGMKDPDAESPEVHGKAASEVRGKAASKVQGKTAMKDQETTEAKSQEKSEPVSMESTKSQPITLSMVKALRNVFANNGIDEGKVVKAYKLQSLEQLNMTAIKMGRRGYGIELNPDYFRDGVGYLKEAEEEQLTPTLFDFMDFGA